MTTSINGKQFSDQEIACQDCGKLFTYTAGEQEFFDSKGFTPPKRCKPCREANKADKDRQRAEKSAARKPRQGRGSR